MTLTQALQQSAHILSINGIEDSCIEARMLLGHITKLSAVQIYTQTEQTLSQEQERTLHELVGRRLRREPTAYIINRREFYGIDFYVDSRVLIPRPETELLVDTALEFFKNGIYLPSPLLIADIGTGCGAIAISLALNLPQSKIYATDSSYSALEVAKLNCEHHKVTRRVTLLQGNLLEPVPEAVDLMVANLPYVKSSELENLSPEITIFEPRTAIDGGKNGLKFIRQLLEQTEAKISHRGCLLLEIGQNQEQDVIHLIHSCLNKVSFTFIPDLNGINRVVKIDF
ncbi:MAG: peptide chain release factor N(5)-glutamine methyltransferase [Dehalococcoidia bacterium]|nr:peptide chain release factor N(5)-glutamine methyltransferase [Dehalococcoidia bacterium]